MLAFDSTITLGNVIEIGTIAVGAIVLLARHASTLEWVKRELMEMQKEIKQISKIISTQTVLDIRLTRLEKEFDESKKSRRA